MLKSQKQTEYCECKVARPFYYDGEPTKKGETIRLEKNFARQMEAANKVEILNGGDQVAESDAVDLTEGETETGSKSAKKTK